MRDRRSFLLWAALGSLILICSIFAPPVAAQTYWFETYQRAVDFIDDGRTAEAAELLDQLAKAKPLPEAGVRIPGNQVLDFLPFYQKARIDLQQGDYKAAKHNLDVSEAFGAITRSPRGKSHLAELRAQVREGNPSRVPSTRHENGAPATASQVSDR